MRVAGRYRVVRRSDHAVPTDAPRPLLGREAVVDVRVWTLDAPEPLLLVNASRKQGRAVQRNRFRRRARMAFLEVLRTCPDLDLPGRVVWVRPARGARRCDVPYRTLVEQLKLALGRRDQR